MCEKKHNMLSRDSTRAMQATLICAEGSDLSELFQWTTKSNIIQWTPKVTIYIHSTVNLILVKLKTTANTHQGSIFTNRVML